MEGAHAQIEKVLAKLKDHQLYACGPKCSTAQQEVEFLGHVCGHFGIKPGPGKTKEILEWGNPKDVGDVRAFLGLCNA